MRSCAKICRQVGPRRQKSRGRSKEETLSKRLPSRREERGHVCLSLPLSKDLSTIRRSAAAHDFLPEELRRNFIAQ